MSPVGPRNTQIKTSQTILRKDSGRVQPVIELEFCLSQLEEVPQTPANRRIWVAVVLGDESTQPKQLSFEHEDQGMSVFPKRSSVC